MRPYDVSVHTSQALLNLIHSGQLLALSPRCTGGLILQKPFYSEFVGAGAAFGSSCDLSCEAVQILGEVQVCLPETPADREQAIQARLDYIHQIQSLVTEDSVLRRAHRVVAQLAQWLGKSAQQIPDAQVARLVGLLPERIADLRQEASEDTAILVPVRRPRTSVAERHPTAEDSGLVLASA